MSGYNGGHLSLTLFCKDYFCVLRFATFTNIFYRLFYFHVKRAAGPRGWLGCQRWQAGRRTCLINWTRFEEDLDHDGDLDDNDEDNGNDEERLSSFFIHSIIQEAASVLKKEKNADNG